MSQDLQKRVTSPQMTGQKNSATTQSIVFQMPKWPAMSDSWAKVITLSVRLEGTTSCAGAQWLSGRALDSRPRGRGFEPHRRHCVVSLSKNINPSLVLVQPRKTRPFITERLLMGRKESNQTNKQNNQLRSSFTTQSKLQID